MKKVWIFLAILFCAALLIFLLSERDHTYVASDYGVLPGNNGSENSKNLQDLIDRVSVKGGTIFIPQGEYLFCQNGTQTYGDHCIKMRSNVSILGSGDQTILMPVGESRYGLDLFYFNDYLDHGKADYLENCRFQDFVIDASGTSCETYTSAGKGFMFNLFRNCHWRNVTVKFTDATGFGVDCPINSTIVNCTAIGCGKAANEDATGASGFGIGYGFTEGESIEIRDCIARDNRIFGFFFEHQGRFDPQRYALDNQGDFLVTACEADNNLYNFGGISACNLIYRECSSGTFRAREFFFEDCVNCEYNGVRLP
ncbi:MAG: hypothetical protein E7470_06650 [Ruminococcaceae bacterium]|nr:hypothetical protein [Oscillospiraceae bacterium]